MGNMPKFRIGALSGDGIGPEVIGESLRVLDAASPRLKEVSFETHEFSAGAAEFLRSGDPFPEETFEAVKACDVVLLGAMGLPSVRGPGGTEIAPQLDLRERLDLYCGLRPVKLYHQNLTPLRGCKPGGLDMLIVRENTEGLFWSRKNGFSPDADEVLDEMRISRAGSERLFRAAFREARRRAETGARKRPAKVTLIDKSNVLPSMAYFRRIFDGVAEEFGDVETELVYVDAAALFLVRRPKDFDVLVTENLFGDILSDLTAGLVGGMGLAPSADVGDKHGMFQPAHGSAPDIAGQGIANPVAAILSVAMMLDWFDHPETQRGAAAIEEAVSKTLADPEARTPDLGGQLKTTEMTDRIIAELKSSLGS